MGFKSNAKAHEEERARITQELENKYPAWQRAATKPW